MNTRFDLSLILSTAITITYFIVGSMHFNIMVDGMLIPEVVNTWLMGSFIMFAIMLYVGKFKFNITDLMVVALGPFALLTIALYGFILHLFPVKKTS